MKLIGYIRVSTNQQEDKGQSLDAQKSKLRAWEKLYPEIEIVDIISDTASGKDLKREGVQRALATLEEGDADGILVAKLDRLTRSIKDMTNLMDTYFKKYQIISVSERLDTTTAMGRFALNIFMSCLQWEREIIGERTREVMQHKKASGEYTGGRAPYGFRKAKTGKGLEEDPREQKIIRIARKLRKKGASLREISRILESKGYLSRTKKPFPAKRIQDMVK